MRKLKIGVCDSDVHYALRLMNRYNELVEAPYKMIVFSDTKSIREYTRVNTLDAVLIGNEDYDVDDILVIKLVEEKSNCKNEIYRYQDIHNIANQISLFIDSNCSVRNEDALVYSVYSPAGGSCRAGVAMQLCKMSSRSAYIGLEEYAVYSEYPALSRSDIGDDFIFQLINRSEEIIDSIIKSGQYVDDTYVVLSPDMYTDIKEIKKNDIEWFVSLIKKENRIPLTVFDIGTGTLADITILDVFDRIIIPITDNSYELQKLDRFKSLLEENKYYTILKKIQILNVTKENCIL